MSRLPNTDSPHADEVFDLFDEYTHGELDYARSQQLSELLATDEAARRQFVALAHLAALAEQFEASPADEAAIENMMAEAGEQKPNATNGAPEIDVAADSSPSRRFSMATRHLYVGIAVAVTFILMSVAITNQILLPKQVAKEKRDSEDSKPAVDAESVARLVGDSKAKWSTDGVESPVAANRQRIKTGMRLYPGQKLVLESGLAEFKFFNGAEVVLEGPAEFEVIGKKQCGLSAGKLVAKAYEERSKGFKVRTPFGIVEDLGTEFGVEVEDDRTIVSVFTGEVDLLDVDGKKVGPDRVVTADQTAYLDAKGVRIESSAKIVPSFRRDMPIPLPRLANGGFEKEVRTGVRLPKTTGRWLSEATKTVGADSGITPYQGQFMLKYVGTDRFGNLGLGGSEVYQAIDLREHTVAIAKGRMTVRASARFNRVKGDRQTDTSFRMTLFPLPTLPTGTEDDVAATPHRKGGNLISDADPETWETVTVNLKIPPGTKTLLVQVFAGENVFNDTEGTEFDGHYVDDVRVEFILQPDAAAKKVEKNESTTKGATP